MDSVAGPKLVLEADREAAAPAIDGRARASGGRAEFFGADMHMFRVAGFQPGRRVLTEPVKPAGGASL
jgi:hypothetical protein